MKKLPIAFLVIIWLTSLLSAQTHSPEEISRLHKLADNLHPKSGTIDLPGGIAVISLPTDFNYLDPKDTEIVLSDLWHNPRDKSNLGMLVPKGFNPLHGISWAVVMSYTADGYVKDDDASTINYTQLLNQMKEGVAKLSEQRQKEGYDSIELIGWAAPPRYDEANHKLYWAKELRFAGHQPDTLNYNIRMLGRRGVLVLNAVADIRQLADVEKATPALLKMVNFQEGHRYADFNPSTDKIATYGLAALVVGGIAAKAGLFKLILVGILAAKKFVVLGFFAIVGFFKKFFQRKKNAFRQEAPPPKSSTST